MRPLSFVLSTLLWLAASNAFPLQDVRDDVKSRTALTCGNPSDAVPFFAANGGPIQDFVATTQNAAITSLVGAQGFTFLGVSARVFTTQETSTTPLYMVYLVQNGAVSDHIYTISESDRDLLLEVGYVDDGIQAYIYPTQICGSVPYYAVYNSAATEHFYTTDEAQYEMFLALAGWSDEGIVGYVLPPNCTD